MHILHILHILPPGWIDRVNSAMVYERKNNQQVLYDRNMCAALVGTCYAAHIVSWVHQSQTLRRGPTGFSKHKILHKNLKQLHASEGLIKMRLGSVSTQDYTASADRAGCSVFRIACRIQCPCAGLWPV